MTTGTVALAPSSTTYRRTLRTAPGFLVAFVVLAVARNGLGGVVVALATAGLCVLGMARYIAASRVEITPDEIRRHTFWGRLHVRQRSDVATVVFIPELLHPGRAYGFPTLMVLDGRTAPIFRMGGWVWARDDIDRAMGALASEERVVWPEPVKPIGVKRRYPRALRFSEAHTVVFGVAMALVALAAIVVVAMLVAVGSPLDDGAVPPLP